MARRTKKRRAPAKPTRHPLLGSLTTDWYWEQDAAHRLTRIELRAGAGCDDAFARTALGNRRWELGIEVEGGWEAHRALLKARTPFRDVLTWRTRADGSVRYASVSGEPAYDRRGRFVGYRGVARDVTEQKRAEQLLRLQHLVTRCMAESPGVAEGAQSALRAICEAEGWDCGEFWRLDERERAMRRFVHWANGAGQAFAAASGDTQLLSERGAVASAWQSGKPLWIRDAANDPRASGPGFAAGSGVQSALLCPVFSGPSPVAVLAFASGKKRAKDEALLAALMALAAQLALFLPRADAEARLRQSEERFRRTFELAAVGVAHIGLDRRFQRVNRRFCEILGYPESELIGIRGRDISHPDDIDMMNAQRPRLYAGEIDAARGEKRYLRKDGGVVWVAYTLAVERDAAGKPLYEIAVYDDITVRRAMEDALRNSEAHFRQVVDSANEGILVYDRDLDIVMANAAAARIIGLPLGELVGRPGFTSLFPCVREDGSRLPAQDRPTRLTVRRGEALTGLVVGLERPNGNVTWLSVNTGFLRRPGESEHYGVVSTISDITDRRRAELKLRESEERFRSLTAMSSDFFWETDPQHRFVEVVHGPEYAERMGRVIGHAAWDLPHVHPDEAAWAAQRATMEAHEAFRDFEFGRSWPDAAVRYFSIAGEPRFGPDGAFLGYRGVGRDVTDIAVARERIATLAYRDALTGLDNRTSLFPALEKSVERSRRRASRLAGLFLDLDGFKEVNDAHGHDAGDRLLVEAARRLRAVLRSGDPVARLGGDEFFVVLEDINDAAPAERVATKLLAALAEPYDIGAEAPVRISASIGVSLFPDDAGDAATLLKHADAAMYSAKQAGKNAYRFFKSVAAANDGRDAARSEGTG
jgi:diguanylate cyclase (GGDEF)-like protein/PAS domain S-box-containing protein